MEKNYFKKPIALLILLVLTLITTFSWAQTVLISPTGNGGFESGATFALNGWSGPTSGVITANSWVCNTGASIGFSGTRAAYVSNTRTATTPTFTYTMNTARATHFWRDVTVPAGESQITLSFSWMGIGEGTFDQMRIWAVPTSTLPNYGTKLVASGTAPTGNIQLGIGYSGQSTWTTATIAVPAAYAGTTFRLVFEWVNDNSLGSNPPAAIDNISLTSQAVVLPANDECANAIALPVNTSCTYLNYTNANATASSGIPAPGCANYAGGDIWFKAVVPANGILNVSSQAGSMTDSGMAFYTGSCGSLSLLVCNDDSNGLMSAISQTGLTPGSTIFIRFWEYGNDNNGTFGICASTLGNCAQMPSAIASSVTSGTAATLSWTAATPAPTTGYDYYYSTSATAPILTTLPSGTTTPATLSTNLTGLTANTTYYFWVRSNCGVDKSAWVAYTFYTGYCLSTGSSSSYYITDFTTNGGSTNISNNASGYSVNGYGNFTGMTVTQAPGAPINFTAAFFNASNSYGFNIWVDWNDDLDFNDPGETVFQSGTYVYSSTGSFIVPASATNGNHRMRIRADYLAINPNACGATSYGETEDYTLNVMTLPCPTYVTGLTTGTVTSTSAIINWTAASPVPPLGYQYYYNNTGTAPVTGTTPSGTTAATTVTLSPLTTNTTYYVWVRTVCNATDKGVWIGRLTFFTGYCQSTSTGNSYYIANFSTSGGNLNISNTASGYSAGGYGNFTAMAVSQNAGVAINFSSVYFNGVFNTYGFNIWVDWNNDMDFNDPGEKVFASGGYNVSNTGSFIVPVGTPLGNYRMRIRADYNSSDPLACGSITNGETEDYTLTVEAPLPCASDPTNLAVNILTSTSAAINWSETSPYPANGYQYYISTATTNPTTATGPSGSVGFGVTVANYSSLTAGVTYHVWIRSNCGGALGTGAWVGPINFIIPTCGIGNSTGTTTLGCHNAVSGGLGLNGVDPPALDCTSSGCTTLEATYLNVGAPTSYTVTSIPYAPPYQFNCLKNPVSVNNDDVWSPVINLPFSFCFYGNNYNKCLISSNGAITFDIVNNVPGGYSAWAFSTGLPDTSLFKNSIFGVYQDIDPRVGGQVGWELITLNSGCRALVASWSNIPMFSCNAQLYTGMMVLYENTNIIDVYIKEKNVCSTWNGGNAIVGIQNAAGTTAVVPPGRNGLDTDWTVTNEAWRFTPSGASTASVKWYVGPVATGPVIGALDTVTVCPTVTTTYTAEVTYSLCNGRTIVVSDQATVTVNKDKVWNGSVGTNWNVAANWTPVGVPTALNCVTIPNVPNNCVISGASFAAYAQNVSVLPGGVLRIDPTNSFTVTDVVTVNAGGTFQIKNSASLIQINNVANIGSINMERITQPMYRYDYTYWGSPVTQASNFTLGGISPATQPDKYYSWIPFIGSSFGTWQQESAASIMDPRKGYIIRAPQTYSINASTKVPYTANFIGVPNNGTINCPILFGIPSLGVNNYNNKYNLLGNPYPSSVSAAAFLGNANNTNVIDGTIYFWTHNSPPSTAYPDPFYNDFITNYTATDYASWNKLGGVGTAASSGGAAPNGNIPAGQSFFVRSLSFTGGNAIFNNSMRSASYSNTQFFRPTNDGNPEFHSNAATDENDDFEKHRIWLNFTNNSGAFSQILIGYAEGATLGWDRGYDGIRFDTPNSINFYSLIPNDILVIQGRPIPFDVNDLVPLGYNATATGEFSIRIDHLDGLFENQNVYLEDKLLNVIHDLKQSPYLFTTAVGRFDDRFALRYNNSILGNNTFDTNGLSAFLNDRKLYASASEPIESIDVFEVNGKLVKTYKPSAKSNTFEGDFDYAQGIYFAKIKLQSGLIVTQKLLNK